VKRDADPAHERADAGSRDATTGETGDGEARLPVRGRGRPSAAQRPGNPDPPPGTARGTLFVVATPIGNLDDITLRAIDTLRSVARIAAEDTRLTRRLLDRHAIATPTTSFHARSGAGRLVELLDQLRSGDDLALVTDAGTPAVSDPGEELVSAWGAEDGVVVPIPGASAVLAAVAATGVAGPRWSFEGFLPRSGRERRERLARIASDERGSVIYEAPNRVAATLVDLAAACGRERTGAIARELTKLHEEILRAPLGELADRARTGELTLRGEFVLVVGWSSKATSGTGVDPAEDSLEAALAEVDRRVADGSARGDAARAVADATGIPRRRLYRVDPA
jgi:16S rRNA (cytidine1402-2'-O)-methyltransferase